MYKSNYGIDWPVRTEHWTLTKFYDKDGTEIIPKSLVECSSLHFRKDVTENKWKLLARAADDEYNEKFYVGCVMALVKMFQPDGSQFVLELSKIVAEHAIETYYEYIDRSPEPNEVHPVEEYLEEAYEKYKHLLETAKSSYQR